MATGERTQFDFGAILAEIKAAVAMNQIGASEDQALGIAEKTATDRFEASIVNSETEGLLQERLIFYILFNKYKKQ
jgi:hypothetical protein